MKDRYNIFKLLVLTANVALVQWACSDDEVVSVSSTEKIEFYPMLRTASRSDASKTYDTANDLTSFNVMAHTTDKDILYIADQKVTLTENGTTFANGTYFWPVAEPLTFFAYVVDYTSDSYNSYKNRLDTIGKFEMNEDADKQFDMVYAVAKNVTKSTANGKVPLYFRHAMSMLKFRASTNNPALLVEIDGISLCNIKNKASIRITDVDTKEADGDLAFTWTDSICQSKSDARKRGISVELTGGGQTNIGNSVLSFDSKIEVRYDDEATGSSVALETDNNNGRMYIIPQELTNTWSPGNGSAKSSGATYFLIYCTVYNICKGTDGKFYGDGTNDSNKTAVWGYDAETAAIAVPMEAINFKQGYVYTFTFNFNTDGTGGYHPDYRDTIALFGIDYKVNAVKWLSGDEADDDISIEESEEDMDF